MADSDAKTTLTVRRRTLAIIEEFRRKDESKEEAVLRAIQAASEDACA